MPTTLFIGLGRMGRPMVAHIAPLFATAVYDIVSETVVAVAAEVGAEPRHDLADLADVETVILMAPTSAHVESVLLESGVLDRLAAGALIIDMGSSVPASTRRLSELAAARGIDYVDAPVSGGIAKAETGELAMLVGGTPSAIERARPYLEAVGADIVVVGDSGAGHAAKSINNLVSAANQAIVNEALIRAGVAGIAPERMVAVLNSSTGMSQASSVKFPRHVLTGAYDSRFAFDLMLKDIGIAMGIEAPATSTPLSSAVYELLTAGRQLLGENPDHTEITRVYERTFNTPIIEEQQ
ncbi:NAD(P)-dependent oxidoreductase [Leucobacter aridicollis]|uniref:NAD(P)-dependent oxidoreductase n=1 Tax=Leucobacter aridicollis TaxID=283878 RepID=UPI000E64F259|nr:NAD(P)-dependent oxidoreductase [Leucobacter aridicollis]UTX53608.1 NAD(P)-dependent oxidoreductase [Leucobacter aridicollis]